MKAIFYILDRASESSSWRGAILLATALGLRLEPELQNQIVAAGLGLGVPLETIRAALSDR